MLPLSCYHRDAIETWLDYQHQSPCTLQPLAVRDLRPCGDLAARVARCRTVAGVGANLCTPSPSCDERPGAADDAVHVGANAVRLHEAATDDAATAVPGLVLPQYTRVNTVPNQNRADAVTDAATSSTPASSVEHTQSPIPSTAQGSSCRTAAGSSSNPSTSDSGASLATILLAASIRCPDVDVTTATQSLTQAYPSLDDSTSGTSTSAPTEAQSEPVAPPTYEAFFAKHTKQLHAARSHFQPGAGDTATNNSTAINSTAASRTPAAEEAAMLDAAIHATGMTESDTSSTPHTTSPPSDACRHTPAPPPFALDDANTPSRPSAVGSPGQNTTATQVMEGVQRNLLDADAQPKRKETYHCPDCQRQFLTWGSCRYGVYLRHTRAHRKPLLPLLPTCPDHLNMLRFFGGFLPWHSRETWVIFQ